MKRKPDRWQNITFKKLSMDGDSPAYQRYKRDCERIWDTAPAAFDVWLRQNNSIGEMGGMKER